MSHQKVTAAPVDIQLLLTTACNLQCIYCGSEQYRELENEPELSTQEWIALLKRLKEIKVFTLTFSGGEIFLRHDIWEILQAASALRFPKISINSNGLLITPDAAKKLAGLNYKHINISLDGDREAHNRLRGQNSFTGALEGINNLIEAAVVPSILFTPLRSNIKSLPAMIDTLYSLGIREISFNSLHPSGSCRFRYKELKLDDLLDADEVIRIVERVRKKYSGLKISKPPVKYHEYPNRLRIHREAQPEAKSKKKCNLLKPCSAGHLSCNITASGWVIPCSELFDFKGGNIREKDILDIWKHSGNFKKIRELSGVSSDSIPYCRNCDYNVFCDSGCRADAYTIFKDILAPDPFCPFWKEK